MNAVPSKIPVCLPIRPLASTTALTPVFAARSIGTPCSAERNAEMARN